MSIDSPKVLDSTTALELPDVPGRLLIVGGGYIGLELGTVYAALGSKVTVVEMTDGLLPGADRDLAAVVAKRMETYCEAILLETKVTSVKDDKKGLASHSKGRTLRAARRNSIACWSRSAAGRTRGSPVSRRQRSRSTRGDSSKSTVSAARPSRRFRDRRCRRRSDARAQGVARSARRVEAIHGKPTVFEPRAIPAVVFTDPELAWAGLTEAEAKQQNLTVDVAKYPWAASGRATTLDRPDGLTKLIVDPETERILGVGIVGPEQENSSPKAPSRSKWVPSRPISS